ncbi:fimbria/pilus periplasmic chaperone [Pseudomonas oryzihabitans]|uniref:fimbria/pilus periplasmic chaperone n=1 Tax=Pseudomonas oryzihabitans TaxID=47885 RepID=UPI00286AE7AB|nr:fimbria/pilus periplasmic chaperone [Pseudomonas psychrotolerans]
MTNRGKEAVLLYSKVNKLPDDDLAGGVLYAVPQAVVVAPGATQTVRIIYRGNRALDSEHFARITFAGMPPLEQRRQGKIKFVIGQDLPVVIGVDLSRRELDIWQSITLTQGGGRLCMKNPTRKVFRFDPNTTLSAGQVGITFAKSYLLPGEELCQPLDKPLPADTRLSINSVSSFNYAMGKHEIAVGSTASAQASR